MKNKQKGSIVILLSIIIAIIIIAGGFYFYKQQKIDTVQQTPDETQAVTKEDKNLKCLLNEKYFVIFKDNEYGTNSILVKKRTEGQQNNCTYIVDKGDVEFLEEEMIGIDGNFLVTGSEAPFSVDLSIYDLRTNKKVYSDSAYRDIEVINGKVFYQTREEATEKNCPQFNEYTKYGDGAMVEYRTSLSLNDLKVEPTGEPKDCVPTQ